MAAPTLRELGLRIGGLEAGPACSIADVDGVRVGHVTVSRDEPPPPEGRGVARSGVTAILPREPGSLTREPVRAGMAVLNGAGELTGSLQIREWGVLETPVYLTATMSVGRVYDGAVAASVAADPGVGVDNVVIPVVGECDDSWLNDARVVQVEAADAGRAVEAARAGGPVEQGAVGAGTGMVCFGWKGGIGTASRAAGGHTVGVLVLANFGSHDQLRVDGLPVGRLLDRVPSGSEPPAGPRPPAGSCIAIVATDAPLGSADLARVARRAGLGLARTGSVAHHGSGEIFLAFSTAGAEAKVDLDPIFAAAVDATEEAVLNCLWSAETTTGREGRLIEALPHDEVLELLRTHRRL
jgi:D-aminopeptidase